MMRKIKASFSRALAAGSEPVMPLLYLVATAGIVLGSISGSVFISELPEGLGVYSDNSLLPQSLWASAFGNFKFLFLAILFSSSFLGVILIPSLTFVKAYTFSCSVAALYSAYSFSGLLCCVFAIAVPTAFALPCLLIAYRDLFYHSRQLYEFKLMGSFTSARAGTIKHLLAIALLLFAVSSYDYFLLPRILTAIL